MAQLLPGEPGTLRLRLQAQGTGFAAAQRWADVDLRLESQGLTLAPGLIARLKGRVSDHTVRLDEAQVRSTSLLIQASGTLSTTDKSALTYELTCGDLASLHALFRTPLQARGRLQGTVQGTWPGLQVRHRLDLQAWRYGALQGQRVQGELSLTQWPAAPQSKLTMQIAALQGALLPPSTVTLTATTRAAQGTLQAKVTTGPYQHSALEGSLSWGEEQRLTLAQLRVQHQAFTWTNGRPLHVVRNAQGQVALHDFLLHNGRQEVSARGILMTEGRLEADVQVQRVQLLPYVRLFAAEIAPIEGEVTLAFQLRGSLTRPEGQGVLQLTALRWHQQDLGTVQSQWRVQGTTVDVDLHWRDQQQEFVRLAGSLGLDTRQALDLQLQIARLDLQIVQSLRTWVTQSAGIVQADLRLTGTVQQPQAYGTLTLRDGAVQLAATGVRYSALQVHLACQGTRWVLTEAQATSGNGTLTLTGWAESAGWGWRHLEVELQMQRFLLLRTPDMEAVVSAALTLGGTPGNLEATGTMTVPQARAQLTGKLVGGPETVQPWQLTVEGVYGAGPPQAVPTETARGPQLASLAFLRADMHLDMPRNVWVRGPGTAIELHGALRVTKALGEPFVLSGTVETVRGFASFYSGKYAVEQGRVTFTGTPELNPVLDVTVTREVSNYVVSVHVSGHANAPQLRLSSTPDLPQADIVTLLVVGKTTDRLTAAERSGLSGQAQQIIGTV
ncbi:MAG: hypothetical protein FJZ47_23260, partial [Candidatus Tectomicrobia bacterium]|nr:hypothetical protein [Candidatus Tectomicrobia bacterium]